MGESDELPISSTVESGNEVTGFAPESLVNCTKCTRANSPLRAACIYCGQPLPTGGTIEVSNQVPLRVPADWEKGFNIIASLIDANEDQIRGTAAFLRQPEEEIKNILAVGLPLPVARTSTRTEADLVIKRLTALGLNARAIDDQELTPHAAGPKLVRALTLTDETVSLNTPGSGESFKFAWTEISLLVRGRFREKRTEINERQGKRQDKELVDVRELTSDEMVLDVYAINGWHGRITATGFNFSCLGADKEFATGQNFNKLVERLRSRTTDAILDDTYQGARTALDLAWPLTQKSEALGWKRHSLGKISTDAAMITDNELQFTRYSRLRYLLNAAEKETAS